MCRMSYVTLRFWPAEGYSKSETRTSKLREFGVEGSVPHTHASIPGLTPSHQLPLTTNVPHHTWHIAIQRRPNLAWIPRIRGKSDVGGTGQKFSGASLQAVQMLFFFPCGTVSGQSQLDDERGPIALSRDNTRCPPRTSELLSANASPNIAIFAEQCSPFQCG